MEKERASVKVVAVVQARMGASRLPNKMMLHLHGLPIIEWIARRVKDAQAVDEVVFAIPDTQEDDILAAYLISKGENVFRGSETNVLDRFLRAAQSFKATHVVRVCADNPAICPVEIDNLINFYMLINTYKKNHLIFQHELLLGY